MSQTPPPLPVNSNFGSFDPNAGRPPSNAMATTALVLGILGLLCLPVGIVALVLGILALSKNSRNPALTGGRGMAIAGIVLGALSLPVSIAILLPSLGKARELANRSVCAANLRGIMQAMVVYSGDNSDVFPYIYNTAGRVDPRAQPAENTPGGLMYSMYYLVGTGSVAPQQFLCKSDPANTTASSSPVPNNNYPPYNPPYWNVAGNTATPQSNFCYSYSFAYPLYGDKLAGWWHNTMDAGVAIGADMNPGNQSGSGRSAHNSPNHQWDGQNVGFADGHAEFMRIPTCGENGDNIYNVGGRAGLAEAGIGGIPPTPPAQGNTQGSFDTCLVPAAADANFTRR